LAAQKNQVLPIFNFKQRLARKRRYPETDILLIHRMIYALLLIALQMPFTHFNSTFAFQLT